MKHERMFAGSTTITKNVAIIALTVLLASLLALTACGSGTGSGSGASGSSNAGANSTKAGLITIGFSQVGAESDWRIANTQSMRETFTEANGYNLILKDAQQKQENQISAIKGFVADKVDYIVLAPVTETGWDEALTEAKNAEIPVIIVDRMINVSDNSLYTCWVGSDFSSEGGIAVNWLDKTYGNDPLNIAHIQGTMGSSAQIGRTLGLENGIVAHSNWNIVSQDSGNFTEAEGKSVMERMLRENKDINIVYCENDNMAFGAIKALNDAHIAFGSNGGIQIISFDATKAGLEYTLSQQIALNVECNPLHGPRVAEIIKQLEAGEKPIKRSYVNETAFEAATITQAVIDDRKY